MIAAVADDSGGRLYLEHMFKVFFCANKFMRLLYNAGLWIKQATRKRLIESCAGLLDNFEICARIAFHNDICRFKMQPKYHMTGELLHAFRSDEYYNRETMNPLSFATQMDEDFVGKIATLSRSVSSRTLHEKTLRRYLLVLKQHWD